MLDEFKSAGVFVNWWQQIRYDLKTIISTGWHHTLIPDEYLIAEFFQAEADEIEALEAIIAEAQSELAEAVETAQEVAAYEPEEDETVTAAVIKKALKELIDDLKDSAGDSAKKELKTLTAPGKGHQGHREAHQGHQGDAQRPRPTNWNSSSSSSASGATSSRPRAGADPSGGSSPRRARPEDKADKKNITALSKDKDALNARLAQIDAVLRRSAARSARPTLAA